MAGDEDEAELSRRPMFLVSLALSAAINAMSGEMGFRLSAANAFPRLEMQNFRQQRRVIVIQVTA